MDRSSAACVCGEINTRHCPVHGQGETSAASTCPACVRLPFGKADGPNPTKLYLCPYCNHGAMLRDEGVVVDRFSNVCHEACLVRERRLADAVRV